MGTLEFRIGDVTKPQGTGRKIIAHGCNNLGIMGAGVAVAIARRWRQAEEEYKAFCAKTADKNLLPGKVQYSRVAEDLWIANAITQYGLRSHTNPVPVSYTAITECFTSIREFAKQENTSVHMPRIGCGLGGGNWIKVEELLYEHLLVDNISIHIYDLPGNYR
jgi:O-acetyl-ADP-ribose deacetylase (regulator of RNase III)